MSVDNLLSAKLKLTMFQWNEGSKDLYYEGWVTVTLPNKPGVLFEVAIHYPNSEELFEIVIRKDGAEVVRFKLSDSEVRTVDYTDGQVALLVAFGPILFKGMTQFESIGRFHPRCWPDVKAVFDSLTMEGSNHSVDVSQSVEWLTAKRDGFEHFQAAVVAEY